MVESRQNELLLTARRTKRNQYYYIVRHPREGGDPALKNMDSRLRGNDEKRIYREGIANR